MSIKLQLPKLTDLRPRLTVIGVGGAGCNAVNNMIAAGLTGVEFVVANTDAQALAASSAEHRLQLGVNLTEGLGAGSKPEIGQAAAEEAIEDIRAQVSGSNMVFVAAGMGGGTGTGAAAVIAGAAKDLGILTIGVVTKPFQFEGARRMRIAEAGIAELKKTVDTLIVIPNQNLFRLANEETTFSEAFILADQVLYSGVACIVDLIIKEGLINLDFADVRAVMSGMGSAMMGTGEASGERRAIIAAEEAIANPLLDDVSLKGARGLLLSITGGRNLTLYEVDEAASRIREEVDPDANIIVGATFDDSLEDRVRVSIVASGMSRGRTGIENATWPADMRATEPSHPAVDSEPAGDVQKRLSDALRYGTDVADYGGPPLLKETAFDAEQSPAIASRGPAASSSEAASETWAAPGNVTIEEGLPPMAQAGEYDAPRRYSSPQGFGDPEAFEPAQSQSIRRRGRRMPEVEDFPPIAQLEYRQKTASHRGENAQGRGTPQVKRPKRRRTFFERLTGRANFEDDSVVDNSNAESRPQTALCQDEKNTEHQPPVGADQGHAPASEDFHQDADLPMFFNRRQR